jgi:hypothetical protein
VRRENFRLQFDPSEIPDLAKRYNGENDTAVLQAGQRIAQGDYSRENLQTIFQWKTKGRGASRLKVNSDGEVAEALSIAAKAHYERSAISVLIGLTGIDVPVASAILTVINPERYTVIDFRAIESLGSTTADRSVDFYLYYLECCRALAERHKVTLRDLDRALWQWSSEKSKAARR